MSLQMEVCQAKPSRLANELSQLLVHRRQAQHGSSFTQNASMKYFLGLQMMNFDNYW